MKALILSGGRGTRLRPITHTSAKQLVPVANKPILFYAIEAIKNAGITDIGIIVGDTHAEIRKACGDGAQWGVHITYLPQDAPLGLAHAVKISEEFMAGEPFVMYLGDNLVKDGITALVDDFRAEGYNAQILLAHVKNPTEFGVAELDGGRVVHLVEKPKEPKTDLALVGVYMFDASIFKAVNSIQPSPRGELEITDAIQYLIDNGYKVHSHVIGSWWKDTGKLDDMLEANRIVLDGLEAYCAGEVDDASSLLGKVHVGKGARIINSVVRGPAIIGENTLVENAYIGPFTSVYYGCTIKNCEIEHSIVLEKSEIVDLGTRVEDSLIGKNVKVGSTTRKPKAYRFMLGDNSEVSVIQ
ncbi:MAG: glucose-1-phosphate thymidylyltransferase [Capsulimonas sp.]|uniref:glucose-1-phosphate thymidylyltransferase n=1 Tax=Capsulimonas sp. TaxID=2494211 RepID=UPI0032674990